MVATVPPPIPSASPPVLRPLPTSSQRRSLLPPRCHFSPPLFSPLPKPRRKRSASPWLPSHRATPSLRWRQPGSTRPKRRLRFPLPPPFFNQAHGFKPRRKAKEPRHSTLARPPTPPSPSGRPKASSPKFFVSRRTFPPRQRFPSPNFFMCSQEPVRRLLHRLRPETAARAAPPRWSTSGSILRKWSNPRPSPTISRHQLRLPLPAAPPPRPIARAAAGSRRQPTSALLNLHRLLRSGRHAPSPARTIAAWAARQRLPGSLHADGSIFGSPRPSPSTPSPATNVAREPPWPSLYPYLNCSLCLCMYEFTCMNCQ